MTKRLYYSDSYLTEFSSIVLGRRQVDKNPAVTLDETAFYPESGGQPCDLGLMGQAHVIRVVEEDDGTIVHILDREIPAGPVSGSIDWTRRFDHMQQHTGQHILSQAFIATAQARTVSFHMGKESSTIDIEMEQPTAAFISEAQELATRIVFENRPVRILTTDRENLASLGVRKESERQGEIRVIDVDGFDRSPCGGTHVGRTGEIGLIFVSGFERYKGGTRVEFVAGGRALKALHKNNELLKGLSRIFSAAPDSIPETAEKLLQERGALLKENGLLRDQLLDMEAGELFGSAQKTSCAGIVRRIYNGRSLDSIKVLAQKLTSRPGILAILAVADACQIVVARSKDLPGSCNDAVKKTISGLGGKGGGRPDLAQAGGFNPEALNSWMDAVEAYFMNLG